MPAFEGEFQLPRLERVVSGVNAVDGIGAELERRGVRRALLVTGTTIGGSTLLTRVRAALGDRCASVCTAARQHVPADSAAAVLDAYRASGADAFVSLGGGSPIDAVKVAIHGLLTDPGAASEWDGPPHVAVPTTLSAGEFTSVAGVTDPATRVKQAITDPRLAPRTVMADPSVTIDTPAWLWAASGIRAVDHAVESLYSPRHHPLSDATATSGLRTLVTSLPASLDDGLSPVDRLTHRGECQLAAWLAVLGMTNAGFGLSHALGHQIGPRWGVPHGFTSCVVLPHAMRFMAGVAPARFDGIAGALDVPFDPAAPRAGALACADAVAALVARLGLPSRLRDVGVPREGMAGLAAVVHGVMTGAGHAVHAGGLVTVGEIDAVLAAAY
jgi:alcohol dehydrogenase class IV